MSDKICKPASRPGPLKAEADVRLALSNELLKIKGKANRSVISLIAAAIRNEWSRLSITQGPAISGKPLPPNEIDSVIIILFNFELFYRLGIYGSFNKIAK